MCRLLSTFGKPEYWSKIVLEFQKLADTGDIPPIAGVKPGHKDGWGMAKSNTDKTSMKIVGKYLGSAMEADAYKKHVDSFSTPPHIFICHLRKASPEIRISVSNAHPFQNQNWVFSHNGTVYQANKLVSDSKFRLTSDNSDSEQYFHYLLTHIQAVDSTKSIPETIIEALLNIKVPFSSLNSMISNGSELYAISYSTRYEDYFSLSYCETTDGIVISSEPIQIPEPEVCQWKEIPNRSIIRISGDPIKKEIFQF